MNTIEVILHDFVIIIAQTWSHRAAQDTRRRRRRDCALDPINAKDHEEHESNREHHFVTCVCMCVSIVL